MSNQIDEFLKKTKPTRLIQANVDAELVDRVWSIIEEKDIKMKDLITAMFLAYLKEQKTKKK